MATNKNKEVIGYDPLAWLGLDNVDSEHADGNLTKQEESSDESEQELSETEEDAIEALDEDDTSVFGDDDVFQDEEVEDSNPIDLNSDLGESTIAPNEQVIDVIDESVSNEISGVDLSDDNIDLEDTMAEQELSPIVDLEPTLTIQHVGALHEKLKLCLALYDEIEINASDVSSIDTATLQLLVALKKDAANLQKQVNIIYPSPRFVESAQLLGLLDILEVTA
ncbi:MAG: STAS domain-containing protein [Methylococcales bacterium]|nr:STAS domain-containing protein [Methylococcaceae bacterium]